MNKYPALLKWHFALVLSVLILGGVLLWKSASGATVADVNLLKAGGWLPAWATLDDHSWLVERREGTRYYVYACLKDREAENFWAIRMRRTEWRKGVIDYAAPQTPLTDEQKRICPDSL